MHLPHGIFPKFQLNHCLVAGALLSVVSYSHAQDIDNGDAPHSYAIASHMITATGPYLGYLRPDADDGNTSKTAEADDNDKQLDDEDGVFDFPVLVQNTKAYTVNVFASNPSDQTATLAGWVDFNGNGIFEYAESALATLPPGSKNVKIKLRWNHLKGVSTDYLGVSYARFRISTEAISHSSSAGLVADGEVEDYRLNIEPDIDGDEIADSDDPDNDNDSIPDQVEGLTADQDGDGVANYLDHDSDGDGIPDLQEAGENGEQPVDTDADGIPDFLDTDSDNDGTADKPLLAGDEDGDGIEGEVEGLNDSDFDGIPNSQDLDSDNDTIPDAVESAVDSDGDSILDYLDLDSDNDGLSDLYESGLDISQVALLDADGDGRVDAQYATGSNGLLDLVETEIDSGVLNYAIADSDADGIRDAADTDSDNDGLSDLLETGGTDVNNDGQVDDLADSDNDGIPDQVDADTQGSEDADSDGISDIADVDYAAEVEDTDGDGIIDTYDPDLNGDGIADSVANTGAANGQYYDANQNGVADFQDDQVSIANGGEQAPSEQTQDDPATSLKGIETGMSGYPGCVLARVNKPSPGLDPTLPVLILFAVLWLAARWVRNPRVGPVL